MIQLGNKELTNLAYMGLGFAFASRLSKIASKLVEKDSTLDEKQKAAKVIAFMQAVPAMIERIVDEWDGNGSLDVSIVRSEDSSQNEAES